MKPFLFIVSLFSFITSSVCAQPAPDLSRALDRQVSRATDEHRVETERSLRQQITDYASQSNAAVRSESFLSRLDRLFLPNSQREALIKQIRAYVPSNSNSVSMAALRYHGTRHNAETGETNALYPSEMAGPSVAMSEALARLVAQYPTERTLVLLETLQRNPNVYELPFIYSVFGVAAVVSEANAPSLRTVKPQELAALRQNAKNDLKTIYSYPKRLAPVTLEYDKELRNQAAQLLWSLGEKEAAWPLLKEPKNAIAFWEKKDEITARVSTGLLILSVAYPALARGFKAPPAAAVRTPNLPRPAAAMKITGGTQMGAAASAPASFSGGKPSVSASYNGGAYQGGAALQLQPQAAAMRIIQPAQTAPVQAVVPPLTQAKAVAPLAPATDSKPAYVGIPLAGSPALNREQLLHKIRLGQATEDDVLAAGGLSEGERYDLLNSPFSQIKRNSASTTQQAGANGQYKGLPITDSFKTFLKNIFTPSTAAKTEPEAEEPAAQDSAAQDASQLASETQKLIKTVADYQSQTNGKFLQLNSALKENNPQKAEKALQAAQPLRRKEEAAFKRLQEAQTRLTQLPENLRTPEVESALNALQNNIGQMKWTLSIHQESTESGLRRITQLKKTLAKKPADQAAVPSAPKAETPAAQPAFDAHKEQERFAQGKDAANKTKALTDEMQQQIASVDFTAANETLQRAQEQTQTLQSAVRHLTQTLFEATQQQPNNTDATKKLRAWRDELQAQQQQLAPQLATQQRLMNVLFPNQEFNPYVQPEKAVSQQRREAFMLAVLKGGGQYDELLQQAEKNLDEAEAQTVPVYKAIWSDLKLRQRVWNLLQQKDDAPALLKAYVDRGILQVAQQEQIAATRIAQKLYQQVQNEYPHDASLKSWNAYRQSFRQFGETFAQFKEKRASLAQLKEKMDLVQAAGERLTAEAKSVRPRPVTAPVDPLRASDQDLLQMVKNYYAPRLADPFEKAAFQHALEMQKAIAAADTPQERQTRINQLTEWMHKDYSLESSGKTKSGAFKQPRATPWKELSPASQQAEQYMNYTVRMEEEKLFDELLFQSLQNAPDYVHTTPYYNPYDTYNPLD